MAFRRDVIVKEFGYDAKNGVWSRVPKNNDILNVSSNPGSAPSIGGGTTDFLLAQSVMNSAKEGVITSFLKTASTIADFVVVINSSTILPERVAASTPHSDIASFDAPLAFVGASATVSIVVKNSVTTQVYSGSVNIVQNPTINYLETE